MNCIEVSVVIPVKNAADTISNCLEAVFSQSYLPYEVIVVDGHSTDKTVDNASKFPVRIIYEGYGTVGGARQVGVNNSRGQYIAFTDADCMPERNWLENLVKDFTEEYVGIGGGIVNVGEGIWKKSVALMTNTFLGSANSVQGRVFKQKRIVKSISGCNSMYRRKDLLKVGGYDINLSVNEETELNTRLSRLGTLLYTPDAVVVHNQERDFEDFAKRMFQFGKGRAQLHLWDLQCVPPLIVLCSLISLIFTPWLFLVLFSFYFFVLIAMGLKIAVQKHKAIYLGSIPVVYLTEHTSYTIGFLSGLLNTKKLP